MAKEDLRTTRKSVDYSTRDWAVYVKKPFDDWEEGEVVSWHSTERGAHLRVKSLKIKELGVRIRQDQEWQGIRL